MIECLIVNDMQSTFFEENETIAMVVDGIKKTFIISRIASIPKSANWRMDLEEIKVPASTP